MLREDKMLNTYQVKKTRELQNFLAKRYIEKFASQIKGFKKSYKCSPLQFIKNNYYYFETFGMDEKKVLTRILLLPLEVEKYDFHDFQIILDYAQYNTPLNRDWEYRNADFILFIDEIKKDIKGYEL